MSQGHLHHFDITFVSKSVHVDKGRGSFAFIVLAIALSGVSRIVGVGLSAHGLVGLQVVEGLGLGAAGAACGRTCAVEELLGGQRGELALHHTIGALNGTNG